MAKILIDKVGIFESEDIAGLLYPKRSYSSNPYEFDIIFKSGKAHTVKAETMLEVETKRIMTIYHKLCDEFKGVEDIIQINGDD